MIFHDFPMFFPCFFPWVSPWVSDGFSHSNRRPARKMGRHQGILQEALSRQDGRSGAVGCGCGTCAVEVTKSPKISQNDGTNRGHLHTFTWFEWETYDVLYYFNLFYAWCIWCKVGEHTHIYIIYICMCSHISNWFFGFKHLLLIDL